MGKLQRPSTPARMCKAGAVLTGLDPDDLGLMSDLVSEAWSYIQLTSVLGEAGIELHYDTMADHLRGKCRCDLTVPLRGARRG